MNAKQHEAILRHGETLQAIFPKTRKMDPVRLCKQLRRLETRATRVTTAYCNGDIQMSECDVALCKISDSLLKLLDYKAAGVEVIINRDPRGYALKIDDEWMRQFRGPANAEVELMDAVNALHRDWGGYGILAPEIGKDGAL